MTQIPAPPNVDDTKVRRDFEYLLDAFRDVLTGLGEADIAGALPWGRDADRSDPPAEAGRFVQAISMAFQLATLAEENAAAQHRRAREQHDGTGAISGLWGRILTKAGAAGIDEATIAERLGALTVEPVLTAHPTEAKRATVLEQHRELYRLLVALENQMWTNQERADLTEDARAILERLWRTGEIFLERPAVAD
ncbi:MAG: phosphoenolpyruvate carboxylase, partial [Acidimicrobiia bacterium]|nr:phosphoenolpyruvate carboxylase [Acidimicrobiia bacterium]